MLPNVTNARFLRFSHLLPSTVTFNDGTSAVGVNQNAHNNQTGKFIGLGWSWEFTETEWRVKQSTE
jgi:hypothetical protein